jgi:hypothetical protein
MSSLDGRVLSPDELKRLEARIADDTLLGFLPLEWDNIACLLRLPFLSVKREGEELVRLNSAKVLAMGDNANVQASLGTVNSNSDDKVDRGAEDATPASSSVDILGGSNSKEDVASALDLMQRNASLESSMGGVSHVGNSASSSTTPENPIDVGVALSNHNRFWKRWGGGLDPAIVDGNGNKVLVDVDVARAKDSDAKEISVKQDAEESEASDNESRTPAAVKSSEQHGKGNEVLDDVDVAGANDSDAKDTSVKQDGGESEASDNEGRTSVVVKSTEQHRVDTAVDPSKPFDYLPPPFLNADHDSSWINSVMNVMFYCI